MNARNSLSMSNLPKTYIKRYNKVYSKSVGIKLAQKPICLSNRCLDMKDKHMSPTFGLWE